MVIKVCFGIILICQILIVLCNVVRLIQYFSDFEAIEKAYNMGVSEQEAVLDKLRAEIEELKPNNPNFKGYFEQNVALNKVLEILDMYKAERSDKE
jgi:hypothetical protein